MTAGRWNTKKRWAAACCALLLAPVPVTAGAQGTGHKKAKPRIEHLACRLGSEDRHARIAVELADGKVRRFAYYSKWKPRTCSIEVERDDAFSQWADFGNTITVTLIEEKGAFLIEQNRGRLHFIFRDVDRMRYCGMEGKINGSLTLWKGNPQCALQGVMDEHS